MTMRAYSSGFCKSMFWLCVLSVALCPGSGQAKSAPIPIPGVVAPSFRLKDVNGKDRALTEFRGRPVVFFFFCGCGWCHDCAKEWSKLLDAGVLAPTQRTQKTPVTVIVFAGEAAQTRQFAAQTGLPSQNVVLLPDPMLRVTDRVYASTICPRVFVLNAVSKIVYTNNHADDAPRKASSAAIIAKTLTAVRRVSTKQK